jgi:hypothetical protein
MDNIITETQALQIGKYQKVWLENGLKRRVDSFYEGELQTNEYYVLSGETEAQLVAKLVQQGVSAFFTVTTQIVGNNTLLSTNRYFQNGARKLYQTAKLFDSAGRLICDQCLDFATGLPVYDQTIKFAYDLDQLPDGEPIFQVNYNEDGSYHTMDYGYEIDNQDAEEYHEGDDLSSLPTKLDLTQAEFDYYLTGDII